MIDKIKRSRKWQLIILAVIIVIVALSYGYFLANPVLPQLAIHFLDEVKLPEAGDTVLVFAPHPDDETIACGGYLNESLKRGAQVYIVLVTDGNNRNLRDLRYLEFESATGILGVDKENLTYLNYPDSRLSMVNPVFLQQTLEEQIEKYQPDILLYPHPNDTHKDHSTLGKITEKILLELREKAEVLEYLEGYEELVKEDALEELVTLKQINKKIIHYKYLVHHNYFPHPRKYAPDLYVLPPLDLITMDGGWGKFMLSPENKAIKEKALNAYASQLRNPLLKNLIRASIRENELFAVD